MIDLYLSSRLRICPTRALSPFCREELCSSELLGELCWRERELSIVLSIRDRYKGMAQTMCPGPTGLWGSM
jgi:hypothetical protein